MMVWYRALLQKKHCSHIIQIHSNNSVKCTATVPIDFLLLSRHCRYRGPGSGVFRSESWLFYKTCTKFTVMSVEWEWKCGNEMCVRSADNGFESADQNILGKQMQQQFRQSVLIWAVLTYHISSSSLYLSYRFFSLSYSRLLIFLYHGYLHSSWVRSFESLTAGLYCSLHFPSVSVLLKQLHLISEKFVLLCFRLIFKAGKPRGK